MDDPDDTTVTTDAPAMPSESELLANMDRSDADAAAGRTAPLEGVVAALRARADRLRAARARLARSA